MKNCKNCGAAAPASASQHSYVCEYCNTKNVDDDYFKEVARTADFGKSDRYAQLGINAYVSDEFENAEKHFESSVLENDKNAEVWIYLALCKSSLLTASNFDKNVKAINDAFKRAFAIDSNSEVVNSGKIAIFEKLTVRVASISDYYFETAAKTFVAFGKDKNAANSAVSDLVRGIDRITTLLDYQVTDSSNYAGLLIDGLAQCVIYEQRGASSSSLSTAKNTLLTTLISILDQNEDLIKRSVLDRGSSGRLVLKLLNQARPGIIPAPQEEKKSGGFLSRFFS